MGRFILYRHSFHAANHFVYNIRYWIKLNLKVHLSRMRCGDAQRRVTPQRTFIYTAGIPRRRHGHGHRLTQHGYNLTSDRTVRTRYIVARMSVSVSASWNASLTQQQQTCTNKPKDTVSQIGQRCNANSAPGTPCTKGSSCLGARRRLWPVSYTHLTLPTILRV